MELTVHCASAVLQTEVFQVKCFWRAMRQETNPYLKELTKEYPVLGVPLPDWFIANKTLASYLVNGYLPLPNSRIEYYMT